jgi:hypothetical protein
LKKAGSSGENTLGRGGDSEDYSFEIEEDETITAKQEKGSNHQGMNPSLASGSGVGSSERFDSEFKKHYNESTLRRHTTLSLKTSFHIVNLILMGLCQVFQTTSKISRKEDREEEENVMVGKVPESFKETREH